MKRKAQIFFGSTLLTLAPLATVISCSCSNSGQNNKTLVNSIANQLGQGTSLNQIDYEILDGIVANTATKKPLTDSILSSIGVSFSKNISELTLGSVSIDYQLVANNKVVGEKPTYTLKVILTKGSFSKTIDVSVVSVSKYEGVTTDILPVLKSLNGYVVDTDLSLINSEETFISNFDSLKLLNSWRGVSLTYEFKSNFDNVLLNVRVIGSFDNKRKFYDIQIYSKTLSEMMNATDSLSNQESTYDLSSLNGTNFDSMKDSLNINLPESINGISLKYSYSFYSDRSQTLTITVESRKNGLTYTRRGGITVYSADHNRAINAIGIPLDNLSTEYNFAGDDDSHFDIDKYGLNLPKVADGLTFTYEFVNKHQEYASISLNVEINSKTISFTFSVYKKSYLTYREFINQISNYVIDADFSGLTSSNFVTEYPKLGINLPTQSNGFTYTYTFTSVDHFGFLSLRVDGTNVTDSFNVNHIYVYGKPSN